MGEYLVEGVKLVREAIELKLPVSVIVGTQKGLFGIDTLDVRTETVTEEVFESISQEKSPQGVIAVVKKPENKVISPNGISLLLDGVADPANTGAIIRTAAAAGYNVVYMTEDCADAYSPKSVRASMSGVFRVNIIRASRQQLLDVIDIPIIVADMDGENMFKTQIQGCYCLVIGNEGHGVSSEIRAHAKKTVKIPMENGMESLNAAVSAGLLMYGLKENK